MRVKKPDSKKREPRERVYRGGREAIVKTERRKARYKTAPFALPAAVTAPAPEPSCAIKERQGANRPQANEYELPSYNTATKITLIVKDPYWLYAYWEISENSIEAVRKQLGGNLDGARFVIRVYDVTFKDFNGFNANHWFDIEVGRHSNNWYISLWNDNVSHCAEIGILHNSGRFFPMARSNFVHTPRSGSSNKFEEIWMDLSQEPDFKEAGRGQVCLSPKDNKADKTVQYDTAGRFSYSAVSKRRKIYITEADLRAYYSRLSPLLRSIMFSRVSRKRLYRYLYSSMSKSEWHDVLYFRKLHGAKFGRKMLLGSSEFMFLGSSENVPQGASEFVQPDKKRKFFFEIGAELIIYGRTEPDAEVKLGDKNVKIRSDGTFSMRFALPDGKINLPFTAVSNDKVETRKISTTVERKTE